uniref:Uncharacterized protein n=1 Tax=Romanomermis culicivorax TaxID=13658 RepID=A0A915J758_ROMCU
MKKVTEMAGAETADAEMLAPKCQNGGNNGFGVFNAPVNNFDKFTPLNNFEMPDRPVPLLLSELKPLKAPPPDDNKLAPLLLMVELPLLPLPSTGRTLLKISAQKCLSAVSQLAGTGDISRRLSETAWIFSRLTNCFCINCAQNAGCFYGVAWEQKGHFGIHYLEAFYEKQAITLVATEINKKFCGILWEGAQNRPQRTFSVYFDIGLDNGIKSVKSMEQKSSIDINVGFGFGFARILMLDSDSTIFLEL